MTEDVRPAGILTTEREDRLDASSTNRSTAAVDGVTSPPVPPRTSIVALDDRRKERFAALVTHARLHARTEHEAHSVMQVYNAVRTGTLPLDAAHDALTHLRREQQAA